jgi:phosphoglycolate phosphatase
MPFPLIWDFDCTLADTEELMRRVYNDFASEHNKTAARKHRYIEITDENIAALRGLTAWDFAKALGVPKVKVPILLMRGQRRVANLIRSASFFTGIPEALRELQLLGCENIIASSNSPENVEAFLEEKQARKLFSALECGIDLFGKAHRLKKILRFHNISPARSVYIGDEYRDEEAARKAGIAFIAVPWGLNKWGVDKQKFLARTPNDIVRIITERHLKKQAED